ncbi:MAG: adenine phosphoribosyltransferase [Flavobacteriaceae bacterium]|jgi:adenine phosphoribosyltransferase|nr:MAG: adenine phosphoribosyltransferase [Flavobacteriaceae bacterium]
MNFKHYIREVPDFPENGVVFKDITPLLEDPKAFQAAADALTGFTEGLHIDKVVGIESRGFFFAPLLASRLGAGFIPARKPGKLPREIRQQEYDLEYGTDALEIHAESISEGDQVLVHDDVLATGGTARAICDLIEQLGGEVVQCNFLIELGFLNGRSKLEGYPLKSLITY